MLPTADIFCASVGASPATNQRDGEITLEEKSSHSNALDPAQPARIEAVLVCVVVGVGTGDFAVVTEGCGVVPRALTSACCGLQHANNEKLSGRQRSRIFDIPYSGSDLQQKEINAFDLQMSKFDTLSFRRACATRYLTLYTPSVRSMNLIGSCRNIKCS